MGDFTGFIITLISVYYPQGTAPVGGREKQGSKR
jgi:hypothetical protein